MKRIFWLILIQISFLPAFSQRQVSPTKNVNMGRSFEQVPGTFADLNGIKMYYEEYGDGDPLLIIPGLGDSIQSIIPQIQFFSKRFHVIAADPRGHGKTLNSKDSLSHELIAKDYNALLEQLDLDSIIILGFNDGAAIALIIAMEYPEKVSRLAIMSARLWTDSTSVINETIENSKRKIKIDMDSIKSGNTNFKSDLMLQHLFLYNPDIDPENLQLIEVPVLVMCGDHDMVLLEHTILIFRSIQNAELSIFPSTTENASRESPQVFDNQVMRFFMKGRNQSQKAKTQEPGGDE